MLAPAGFRGAGLARPGRRRLPLPGHGGSQQPFAGGQKQTLSLLWHPRERGATAGPERAPWFAASAAASRKVISLVPSRLGRKGPGVPAWLRESRQRSARQGPAAVSRRAGLVNVQSDAGKPCLPCRLRAWAGGEEGARRTPTPASHCQPGCSWAGPTRRAFPSCPDGIFSPWKLC